ncbi:MAG: GGDEF domain-containing protein [Pseudomonadota bacterium]
MTGVFMAETQQQALLAGCVVLGVIALVFVAATITSRRESRFAARLARERGERMGHLLRTVRLAESIAELGVWQYDPVRGVQQWSAGMRMLFGVDPHEEFVAGDAETLLFANDIDLVAQVSAHSGERGPFELFYDIHGCDRVSRTISVQACNMHNKDGEVVHVVAVVRDVTDQVSRERQLEQSRVSALQEASVARKLAQTDPLTGLANRRRVMAALDQLVVRSQKQGQPLAVVLFDIDHFKSVNDTYGHPHGDRVLQEVGKIAMKQAREGDIVGRVGGEEFVWIVPGADQSFARIVSERLRLAISMGTAIGDRPPVTTSIGFTSLMPGDAALKMFARADAALYEAKGAGRNQVRMAA